MFSLDFPVTTFSPMECHLDARLVCIKQILILINKSVELCSFKALPCMLFHIASTLQDVMEVDRRTVGEHCHFNSW